MLCFQSHPSSVSQKVQLTSPQVPQWGALMGRVAHFQSLLLHVSCVPHKSCPDKKFHPSLEGPRKGMFPETGPRWKKTPISRALLSVSFGVPSKGALPPGLPHRAPRVRDAAFREPSFIHLSKSPVNEHPSRIPSGAPVERDAHLQSLPLHNLHGPQYYTYHKL